MTTPECGSTDKRVQAEDAEARAVKNILKACGEWLAAQQGVQPAACLLIQAQLQEAAELRIEVTCDIASRITSLRACTLNEVGKEVMLIRSLNAGPATSAAPVERGG
jgi:hypothetical protein